MHHTDSELSNVSCESFEALADFFKVKSRLVISLEHLARIGGSSLTDNSIPVSSPDLIVAGIPSSYVPFRNAHLLAAAVSWGEVIQATAIYIGAVAEDSSGYPDCRPEFYAAFQELLDLGTKPETRITIKTPVIGMRKSEIVRKGLDLEAPLHLTWSCYQALNWLAEIAIRVLSGCAHLEKPGTMIPYPTCLTVIVLLIKLGTFSVAYCYNQKNSAGASYELFEASQPRIRWRDS